MKRWFLPLLLAIAAGAAALRLPQLDLRPMHNDEGVNAIKIQALWQEGSYRYDPHEFHGPTLYYATLPFIWLSSAQTVGELDETTLRGVTVAFGLALILLLWFLRDAFGRVATLAAAALTALSPAMVFYSRYYIHEMLLVAFTLLLLAALWRYGQSRHPAWAITAGTALGLMYATKETFVLALAALGFAALATLGWNRWRDGTRPELKSWWNLRHLLLALVAAFVVAELLFTSFLTNWRGPLDSILTYLPWTQRAGGQSPHIHPWYFYFERLFFYHLPRGPYWSEGLILVLAVIGFGAGLAGKRLASASAGWIRFIGFYTVFLVAIYSVISYKTPWCLLGFFQGMILLAGTGAAVLLRLPRHAWSRTAVASLLLLASAHLGWEAWRASFAEDRRGRLLPAGRENPYVYAQTLPDVLELVEKVKDIARIHPDRTRMPVKVMASDYLPLPWYLRELQRIGWWDAVPEDPYAPVMIVGGGLEVDPEPRPGTRYYVSLFSLRERTYLHLYVEADLWEQYVNQPPPPPTEPRP